METSKFTEILRKNSYPGRGIAIGLTPNGKKLAIVYFIMGRSENSQNRIFVEEGMDLRTKAFDDFKLTDSSLIIYYPVRVFGNSTIVTNGDQTDTIFEFLNQEGTFEAALNTREFEPDAPNFTPRISGIASISEGKLTYKLSILKTLEGNANTSLRYFFNYDIPQAGTGHFIHTYQADGNPLLSFEGEPRPIELSDCFDNCSNNCVDKCIDHSIDDFTQEIWDALDKENKVSLFVRFVDINDFTVETRVKNLHVI